MSTNCRDCGTEIKSVTRLGDKLVKTWSRKYCFTCSPYKSYSKSYHVTKTTPEGLRSCAKCKEIFPLSNFYKRNRTGNYSSYCIPCERIINRCMYLRYKKKCLDYKGGCCSRCGYNKCLAALDFHHLDPKEKDFIICQASRILSDRIKKELDKCIILCSNCHREVHNPDMII